MTNWRFWPSEADGQAWLANPVQLHAVVVYEAQQGGIASPRAVTVVTKGWVERELSALSPYPGAANLALPAAIVLRDDSSDGLRRLIDQIFREPSSLLVGFSRPAE